MYFRVSFHLQIIIFIIYHFWWKLFTNSLHCSAHLLEWGFISQAFDNSWTFYRKWIIGLLSIHLITEEDNPQPHKAIKKFPFQQKFQRIMRLDRHMHFNWQSTRHSWIRDAVWHSLLHVKQRLFWPTANIRNQSQRLRHVRRLWLRALRSNTKLLCRISGFFFVSFRSSTAFLDSRPVNEGKLWVIRTSCYLVRSDNSISLFRALSGTFISMCSL